MKKIEKEFDQIHSRLKLDDFIVGYLPPACGSEVLQSPTAKRKEADRILLQLPTANSNDGFAKLPPLPHFLALTTFTNHIEIINRCRTNEGLRMHGRKRGWDKQCGRQRCTHG